MTCRLPVVVLEDWLGPDGQTPIPAGRELWVSAGVYRTWKPLGYLGRQLSRCVHWSGREYWHQVAGCSKDLYLATDIGRPPLRLDFPQAPAVRYSTPVVYTLPSTKPPVVTRGCGCGSKTKTVEAPK